MSTPGALKSLQQRMAASIMQPLTRDETMVRRRRADGVRMEQEADAFIRPNDRLNSFERLEIYNRQYWFRLYTSFEEDFPGLRAIVGRRKFEAIMRGYLTDCPSRSFTLRNLGSRLEEWLTARPELIAPRTALALDMVRLEWAHIESFDEAALPPLTADDLAAVNGESRFRLQPHLRLLRLHFPVDDLLIHVRDDGGSGDAASNNAFVARRSHSVRRVADMPEEDIFLAVHRHENSVYYKRLHPEDFRMLQSLSHGHILEEAIGEGFTGSSIPEDGQPAFLQEAFSGWSSLGWFSRFGEDNEPDAALRASH